MLAAVGYRGWMVEVKTKETDGGGGGGGNLARKTLQGRRHRAGISAPGRGLTAMGFTALFFFSFTPERWTAGGGPLSCRRERERDRTD